ncbi:MAG: hypothetical protein ACT4PT_08980 [Methanobacteriota archaeon]
MRTQTYSGEEVRGLLHDLRNHLAAAHGYVQVVIEEHGDAIDEDGRAALERAQKNLVAMESRLDSFGKEG